MKLFRSKTSLGFGVFALAALVVASAAAQQNAPAAVGQSGPASVAQTDESAMQGAKPNEADDQKGDAALLHSPVVKATARLLHMKLDTAIYLLLGLNFAIIFFAIAIPLTKTMPKVLRKRSQNLSHELTNARKATADAQARLSAVEAQLAGLGEEIRKLTAQVEQETLEDEKRIKASIGEESARIVAAAEQEIGAAATQAKRALRSFAADLAIGHAEKQITLTPETDRALIAEFVAGAAGDGRGKGGMN